MNRIVEILSSFLSFSISLDKRERARGRTVASLSVPGTGDGLFLVVEPNVSSYEGSFRRSWLTRKRDLCILFFRQLICNADSSEAEGGRGEKAF